MVATPGSGEVTISCDAVTGATKYRVYQATAPGEMATYYDLRLHSSLSSSSCAAIPWMYLTPGAAYYFVVTAWNLDGESDPSPEVSATPL